MIARHSTLALLLVTNTLFCAQHVSTKSWRVWLKEHQGYFLTAAASIALTATAMTLQARTAAYIPPTGQVIHRETIQLNAGDSITFHRNFNDDHLVQKYIFSCIDRTKPMESRVGTQLYQSLSDTERQCIDIIAVVKPSNFTASSGPI